MPKRSSKGATGFDEVGDSPVSRLTARMRSKYGEDSAAVLSGDAISGVTDWISTQDPMLDAAIGHPGIPVGRITTIIGETSSGKTTLCYQLIAETQRRGGFGILVDAETAALGAERARICGVIPEDMLVLSPETLEEACSQIETAIEEAREIYPDRLVTIVFDSVSGAPTKDELEAEYGDRQIGGHARIMHKAMRRMNRMIAGQKVAVVLTNQYRDSIGGFGFGPTKTMIAERPIRYFSSIIMEIARIQTLSKGEGAKKRSYGIKCKAKLTKNKVAPPFAEANFRITWAKSVDTANGLFNAGLLYDVIESPSKGWYQYADMKFREDDFEAVLQRYPGIRGEILDKLKLPEHYPSDSKMLSDDWFLAAETQAYDEEDDYDEALDGEDAA